jgi:hypothetical protein
MKSVLESMKRASTWIFAAVLTGTTLVVAAPAASADSSCKYGYLCIFDGFSYGGEKLSEYRCGFANIGAFGWSDRLRAFKNNQTPGTVTKFFNWDGASWVFLDQSVAPEFIPVVNFPLRTTDGIEICR